MYSSLLQQLQACPFCPALEPTLAQLREDSAVCLLGEARTSKNEGKQPFLIQQRFKGDGFASQSTIIIPLPKPLAAGELRLMFGGEPEIADASTPPQGTGKASGTQSGPDTSKASGTRDTERDWTLKPADETLLAYFARAPHPRQPSKDRLPYFAKHLEHADPQIAADALMEFAHADLTQVREILPSFESSKVRGWLADETVRPEHKGFYALILGLLAQAEPRELDANLAFLVQLVFAVGNDYRVGHDGMIAGYLLAGGKDAFAKLDEKLLTKPDAPAGDLKHAVTALRFFYEYGAADLRPQTIAAMTVLAQRPVTAASAIIDLTRWQAWDALPQLAVMYDHAQTDAVIKRAVIGYLRRNPEPAAKSTLEKLREKDPAGVAAAEAILDRMTGRD